nr:lupus la ribonucleoprotein putative [Hymenolepis microstoma]
MDVCERLMSKVLGLPFDILFKFKRLAQLTTDAEVVKKALASSTFLEVSDKGVRRNPSNPAPTTLEEAMQKNIDRALYVKGFPLDMNLDGVISYLEKNCGETIDVFLKRGLNRKFKGSIYVTFKEKEAADKFMTSPDFAKYNDKPLLRKYYKDYRADKQRIIQTKIAEKEKKKNNLRKRITEGALLELSGLPPLGAQTDAKPEAEVTEDKAVNDENQGENDENIIKGTELDLGVNSPVTKRTVTNLKHWINEKMNSKVQIGWVDILPTENKAIIRFKEAQTASKVLDELKKQGEIVYEGYTLDGRCIEGEEELDIWKNVLEKMESKKRKASRPHGGGRFPNKRRRRN